MTRLIKYLFFFLFCTTFSQNGDPSFNHLIISPEIMIGTMPESNSNFPSRGLQTQFLLSIGRDHRYNSQEWAQRLKGPRTGISLGYTDFGNKTELGEAITLIPFIEFKAFKKEFLKINTGLGASIFSRKYHPVLNPNNQAVSTQLTWSFKFFVYYNMVEGESQDWRLSAGVFHHSNGHSKLPNNGYNSFLLGVSTDFKNFREPLNLEWNDEQPNERNRYDFITFRSGIGQNIFSLAFNDLQNVYTISGEYGRIYNNVLKIGVGFYYRYYSIYHNYIKNDEFLVQDGNEFDHYKEQPLWNSSNLGLSLSGEFLLNHIGINVLLGINIHKPGYKLDWRINQGYDNAPVEIPDYWVYGEFDTKYKLKRTFSTRLGLKYYLFGTKDRPRNNFFIGMHLNANGGQADFTELSLGYQYNFKM